VGMLVGALVLLGVSGASAEPRPLAGAAAR
jgi:hypothetical protein